MIVKATGCRLQAEGGLQPAAFSPRPSQGFTLIEIAIVIAIIGLVMALGYPQYQAVSHSNLRTSSRKLAGTIRYIYAQAVLDKKPWRLAIDFEHRKYWGERLEEQAGEQIEQTSESEADDSWAKLETMETDHYSLEPAEDSEQQDTAQWMKVSTRVLKENTLPKGIVFKDMRVVGRDEVSREIGYIYFSPYGGVERAVVHLKHEDHDWFYTIVTKPLTGRVAIFDEYKDIEHTPITGQVRE